MWFVVCLLLVQFPSLLVEPACNPFVVGSILLCQTSYFRCFRDERDKRRAEREKDDEEALVGGLGKKKGPAGGESQLVP